MRQKKGLAVVLTLTAIMLFAFAISAFAADECYIGDATATHLGLTEAIAQVTDGQTIHLLSDVSLTGQISLGRSVSFTIDGTGSPNNYSIKAAEGVTTRIFNIGAGSLTLTNVTVADGNSAMTNTANQINNGGLIWFHSSGNKLTLGTGAVLTNGTSGQGGAIWVMSGTFVIDGGIIENCNGTDGGAIYLSGATSRVEFKNGYIRNNNATSNGGALFLNTGTVSLSGSGEMYNNTRGTTKSNIFMRNITDCHIELAGAFTGKVGIVTNVTEGNAVGGIIGTCLTGATGAKNIIHDNNAELTAVNDNGNLAWHKDGECYITNKYVGIKLTDAIAAVTNGQTIHLLNDVYLTAQIGINRAEISFTIDGDGHKIAAQEAAVTRLFRIVAGNVTFTDITLADGNSATSNPANNINRAPLIWMNCTGYTVTLGEGAVLTNGTAEMGGAIWIQNGNLTLDGGIIENCYAINGGAVMMGEGTVLEMKDGYIRNNKARDNGGAIFFDGGTIVLSGDSEIYNNLRATAQNNIFYHYTDKGTIKLSGAFTGKAGVNAFDASGNVAGKVIGIAEAGATGAANIKHDTNLMLTAVADNGNLVLHIAGDTYITNKYNGMTFAEALATVNNGETIHLLNDISLTNQIVINRPSVSFTIDGGDYAIKASEGAVTRLFKVSQGNITFENITLKGGNTNVTTAENEVNRAGLLWIQAPDYTVTLGEGAILEEGTSDQGGAIWVQLGTLLIDGGIIENCYAVNGGAVLATSGGIVEMNSGYIRNNTARDNGAGLFINNSKAVLSGDSEIYGNLKNGGANNIFLYNVSNSTIEIDGAFTGKIGVYDQDENAVGTVIGTCKNAPSIESINTITCDPYSEVFAYLDGNSIVWQAKPILAITADSGVYNDGTEDKNIIRYITSFAEIPETAEIEHYGTFIIDSSAFTGSTTDDIGTKYFQSSKGLKNGEDYILENDMGYIVDYYTGEDSAFAISYVYIKGIENPYFSVVKSVSVDTEKVLSKANVESYSYSEKEAKGN